MMKYSLKKYIVLILVLVHSAYCAVLSTSAVPPETYTFYIVKNYWHTGIVLKTEDIIKQMPYLDDFGKYQYVDIGWGDEAFYQHDGFDAGLAVKALFYPTPSALRVEGFNLPIDDYISRSDMAVMFEGDSSRLQKICVYILNTFIRDSLNHIDQLSSKAGGSIRFFKAKGEYHLFNTCNTWIARLLKDAGYETDDNVITAGELFKEAARTGKLLKTED